MKKTLFLLLIGVHAAFAAPSKVSGTSTGNVVHVESLSDLPSPYQGVIKLASNKLYKVHGLVNIGNNAINLNGAGLSGDDPGKDGFLGTVNGAILRSRDVDVYLDNLMVVCGTSETKGYDFVDMTGTKYLNLFAGCSVVDAPNIQGAGVGTITGFNVTCIVENYWKCRDGLKVTGQMEKFTSTLNYVTGITNGGVGIEFLANSVIKDIVIQTTYFVYSGETGIKINKGAIIDHGRLSLNLFRGVTNKLDGFDSFTPGWEMYQNGEGIQDSKGNGFIYLVDKAVPVSFKGITLYSKIPGQTKTLRNAKFLTDASNRFVFTGKRLAAFNVNAIVSAISQEENASFTLGILKNGKEVIEPGATVSGVGKGSGIQINLITQVELDKGDFIELCIKNNSSNTPVIISDMQFKISE
ncbi:hypothetical protein CHU92_01285 [Flavobacterium cyanobacteriorum]|uniref:Uncharacterized protein n=1 Tax=Flavobacterium cyanobacteriorum TaxID=2022802 RepID=A0A255ZZL7_9FLAO|nr:hypothetical protein [Flavobacterium cyanobacteriorum]OYQ46829.1 hypothetical protein CHU92_01285 [Flavobacterium cyanobacteriorum]